MAKVSKIVNKEKSLFCAFAFDKRTKKEKSYKDKNCYRKVLKYVLGFSDENKRVRYRGGHGVDFTDIDNAVLQFKTVSKMSSKNNGATRKIYHFFLRFNDKEFDPNLAQIAGDKISEYIFEMGHQNIYAVHEDTEYCHIHFIYNARNFFTGKQYHASKKERDIFLNNVKQIALDIM